MGIGRHPGPMAGGTGEKWLVYTYIYTYYYIYIYTHTGWQTIQPLTILNENRPQSSIFHTSFWGEICIHRFIYIHEIHAMSYLIIYSTGLNVATSTRLVATITCPAFPRTQRWIVLLSLESSEHRVATPGCNHPRWIINLQP